MTRWYGIAALTMGLALGACGGGKKNTTPTPVEPAFVPAPDAEALVGTWSDGKATFTFNGRAYKWSEVVPCGAPTCQENEKGAGEYELRNNGKVVLKGGLGDKGDLMVTYAFQNNQKTVVLSDGASTWTLNKR
jgi:hypothetical protein